jgi:monovalent cation:H+ antiporter-2, CPA2 family
LTEPASRPLLAAGIASMFVTPLMVRAAPHITAGARLLAPLERAIGVRSIDVADEEHVVPGGHVIIVGFGLAGKAAAQTLEECAVPCVVLEMNADNVRRGKALGLPVYYGDATSPESLSHANITTARVVVLLMNDHQAARRIVDTVRRVAPGVPVLMRARYWAERGPLLELGAHDVVAEEVEGAVEMISRLMRFLDLPRNVIDERIHAVRADTQTTQRKLTAPRARLGELRALDQLKVESAIVRSGSAVCQRSPVELRLRSETGALVVGIKRDGELLPNSDPTQPFEVGDVVYLIGDAAALAKALPRFD